MIHGLDNTNLLTWLDEQKVPAGLIHSANCFRTMGGGIAKQIKEKYPQAYEADLDTPNGDPSKLGTFSFAEVGKDPIKIVYNMYGQFRYGREKRQTSYDAFVSGLEKIRIHAMSKGLTRLGLPDHMGSTLGGGNWVVVRAIIASVFDSDKEIDLYICKYGS